MRCDPAVRDRDVSGPQAVLPFVIHKDQVHGVSVLERISHGNLISLARSGPPYGLAATRATAGGLLTRVPGRNTRHISIVAHAFQPRRWRFGHRVLSIVKMAMRICHTKGGPDSINHSATRFEQSGGCELRRRPHRQPAREPSQGEDKEHRRIRAAVSQAAPRRNIPGSGSAVSAVATALMNHSPEGTFRGSYGAPSAPGAASAMTQDTGWRCTTGSRTRSHISALWGNPLAG